MAQPPLLTRSAAPGNAGVPATAPPGSWSIVTSPNAVGSADNYFYGTTCVSASDCWAVGTGAGSALIEHFDGTSWTITASPSVASEQLQLFAVACASAGDCWAVGTSTDSSNVTETLAEHWDGGAWGIVASANSTATDNWFASVTCVASTDCWAAGGSDTGTLVDHWDGSAWSVVSSPSPSNAGDTFTSVSCVSSGDCWAVGYLQGGNPATQTLAEHWDGAAWTVVSTLSPSSNRNVFLGVACSASTDCLAVGFADTSVDQTLTERWDGTSWSLVTSGNVSAAQDDNLQQLACRGPNDCWAVGFNYDPSTHLSQTLTERWDGAAFSITSSPDTSATDVDQLLAITCLPSDCWAAGLYIPASNLQTLTLHWDGSTWTIATSPNRTLPQGHLNGIACPSPSACWAVGWYDSGGGVDQTLIESWDGADWRIVTSPDAGTTVNERLDGVACDSASDCWTVGGQILNGVIQTLTEHWDGTSWSIVTSPDVLPNRDAYLVSVSCASSSDCWAVGYYDTGFVGQTLTIVYQPLLAHWNGSAWSLSAATGGSASPSAYLDSVTCMPGTVTSTCWAVGATFVGGGGGGSQTLTELLTGAAWTPIPSPDTSSSANNWLLSVTCLSNTDCSAVGYAQSAGTDQTLAEQWNGTAWSIVPSADTGSTLPNDLLSVTCNAPTDCWSTGVSATSGNVAQTLIEHWDGASWTVVASPNAGGGADNELTGVTCVSAGACWAVGAFFDGVSERTLIEALGTLPGSSVPETPLTPVLPLTALSACWLAWRWRRRVRRDDLPV